MPSIASIFKPKIIRRVLLTMLLAAPIVYLFGTQIATLAGAHGEPLLASSYVESTDVPSTDFTVNRTYDNSTGEVINSNNSTISSKIALLSLRGSVTLESTSFRAVSFYVFDESDNYLGYVYRGLEAAVTSTTFDFELSFPSGKFVGLRVSRNVGDGSGNIVVSSCSIDWEIAGNYSESLFSSMFGNRNFLTDWGTSVLDDTAVGFEPVNVLLQYVGGDMLHLGDTQIGLMALGYSTYVFNVLIVYMLVSLCASLICLPLKATDIFNRGENL